mgnify:CR=1 FL=1
MGLSEKKQFDLILKGGNIIDPANNINGKMDIAIADKFIAKIDKEIDIEKARNVVDVSGMVIVPGLIDLHAHFFGYFASVQPDPHCIPNGTTTAVDAGGSGYKTFDEFNSRVITKSITRVFALLNIAGEGMVGEPEQDLEGMSTEFTAKKIRQREDLIVGVKVAHYAGPGWEPLDRGVEAVKETGTFLMVDQTPQSSRPMDKMMLGHMQPGDIVTHCYAYSKPMIDSHNKVHSYFYEARNKGILFDVGHGAGSFSFKIAKNAISQKFLPDTISTDMHVSSLISNHATMPEVMSKLLACGMDLNDVVQKSTYDPSKKIGRSDLGSLSESTIADIAVLKISEGDFGLTDNGSGIRVLNSNKRIECEMTIKDGKILWDINGRSKDDWESTPTPYQISNV